MADGAMKETAASGGSQNRYDHERCSDQSNQGTMKLLFLDGVGSNPTGRRPAFLREHGFEVAYPILPEWDFEGAVRTAQDAFDADHPMSSSGIPRRGGGDEHELLRRAVGADRSGDESPGHGDHRQAPHADPPLPGGRAGADRRQPRTLAEAAVCQRPPCVRSVRNTT